MASQTKDSGPARQMSDGITNVVTGLGTTRDPRSYNAYFTRCLTDREIYAAYASSWLMTKIVNKPAVEMVREWRDWQADADQITLLEKLERKLGIRSKIRQAEVLRGLGGAGMVLWVGNEDPSFPINPRTLTAGSLRGVHVWHRSRFALEDMETDPASEWYGFPKFYRLSTRDGRQVRLHPSRVIAFRAQEIPDMGGVAWSQAFWGMSQVQVCLDAVQNSDTAQASFAAMFKDARNRRIGIPGLTNMLATAEGEKIMQARMAAVASLESMLGVTFYDSGSEGKEAEKIEDRQMTWTGIDDINNNYLAMVAGAADMPATILLGKSPDGQNATGESDTVAWEKTIKSRQDLDLRPCMDQLDAVLIPSALGKADDKVWWEFAPLSTMSEKDEATTFFTFMQAIEKLQSTGAIPDVAFAKALQNALEERGYIAGLGAALAEIPEDERFAMVGNEGNQNEADLLAEGAAAAQPAARATNDRRFTDANPQTLYVSRRLLNAADLIAWAKKQGFEVTQLADAMHVTVCFSRQAVDWMKIGQDWSSDKDGNLTVPAGGPRIVQKLGPKGAVVLLFGSSDLTWRHQAFKDAGASFDFDEYQPHVTITYQAPADLDLSKVEPYTGPLKFGPELFAQVVEDWEKGITEDRARKRWPLVEEVDDRSGLPFADAKRRGRRGGGHPSHGHPHAYVEGEHPRGAHGKWVGKGEIQEHVSRALASKKELSTTSLGPVSEANAAKVHARTGIDITGHTRVLHSNDIRHVMNSHGDPVREAARGQVAIKKADFTRIPDIVENAYTVKAEGSRTSRKGLRLNYAASIDGHEYEYTEMVQANRIVALKSMRKK